MKITRTKHNGSRRPSPLQLLWLVVCLAIRDDTSGRTVRASASVAAFVVPSAGSTRQRHGQASFRTSRQPTSQRPQSWRPQQQQRQQHQQQGRTAVSNQGRSTTTCSSLAAVGKTGGDVIATAEEFEARVLQSTTPVMVFFTAPWCGPCRLSIPVVKEVVKEYATRMPVVEVCTDDLPAVAAQAGVVSIPTIQMYADRGNVRDTIVGCVAKAVLKTAVEKVLEDVATP